MKCLNCSKETANPKFCCRSCAASTNNKLFPKRVSDRKCTKCDEPACSYRSQLCTLHREEFRVARKNQWATRSLSEFRNSEGVLGKHPSWANVRVRLMARTKLSHLSSQPCSKCGYDKHVELAHIQPVTSFPDTALISEVNSESNIIPLCPNCHWEFDNLPRDNWFDKVE